MCCSLGFVSCSESGEKTAGTATDVLTGSISGTLANYGDEQKAAKVYLYKKQSPASSDSSKAFMLTDSLLITDSSFVFENLESGTWQVLVRQGEILIGESELILLRENQNVHITINVYITIEQHFTIFKSDQYNITNIYLANGMVASDEDHLVLTFADGIPDTLWFEFKNGDSLDLVPAFRTADSSGVYRWDFSQLPQEIVIREDFPNNPDNQDSLKTVTESSSLVSVSSSVEFISSSSSFSSSAETISSTSISSEWVSSSGVVPSGLCSFLPGSSEGTFWDTRDTTEYKCIQIGSQIWMAQNLNWNSRKTEQDYCFENDPNFCDKYGRLYTWGAIESDTLCPYNWQIPNQQQWETLANFIRQKYSLPDRTGGVWQQVGTRLKSDHGEWSGVSDNADGFSALPAGYRTENNQWPDNEPGMNTWFYTSTEINWESVMSVSLASSNQDLFISLTAKNKGMSIRCIQSE